MKRVLLLLFMVFVLCVALISCGGNGGGEECKHSFTQATCKEPATCTLCGETEGDLIAHSFTDATCTAAKTCTSCGKTEGAAIGHSFTPATCTSPKTCQTCGETEGVIGVHIWKNTGCTTPVACQTCGAEGDHVPGHAWTNSLCTADKMCRVCGLEEGPKGHTWNNDNCNELQTCQECMFIGSEFAHEWGKASCDTPKKCTRCDATNGEPLGHDWFIMSCKVPKICQRCSFSTTEDLPHQWIYKGCDEERICDTCYKKEGFKFGHSWVEATCASASYCENCEMIVGDALGHNWEWISTTEPLCEAGKKVYFCDRCEGSYNVSISAIYGYHICGTDGICIQCDNQFDLGEMTLESVLIANEHSLDCCGIFTSREATVKIYKSITADDVGMPVIDIGGSLPTSKGYENTVNFTYESEGLSFDCTAKIKVQGASSAGKPKKNFNIKLLKEDGSKNKVELVDGWGKENKYCMKANYIDYSQSRNVVSGQIFGQIVKSRNDELVNTPNGGAIDGFPILVYNNGVYQGLYTMNIPKDNWMFDMKHSDEKNQAIFMTDTWNSAVSFKSISTSGFVLEYASNEDSLVDNNTQWAYDSMLDLIEFVYKNDGEAFKNGIHEYADIDKCIDSMIYTFFICADDNTSKNILWVTLDGKVWFSSMYDMDGTWGMRWNGNIEFNENSMLISSLADGKGLAPERNPSNLNLLWERIYINYYDRVCQRYWELRKEILTEENISVHFEEFFAAIPDVVRDAEKKKWTGVPTQNIDHLKQILDFAIKRIEVMDKILVPKE